VEFDNATTADLHFDLRGDVKLDFARLRVAETRVWPEPLAGVAKDEPLTEDGRGVPERLLKRSS
jgi:hypothetical protein